ncbi:hypothetical protein, partial [Streptomyces sp. IBSBF 2390]|uniref:hypothetical protein n=1 Tax=Streptomyces sp. IBSBF 2390 TaxID=2903533 RepID=UPI002FDBA097
MVGYADDIAILARSKVSYEKGKTRVEALTSALNEISKKIEDALCKVKYTQVRPNFFFSQGGTSYQTLPFFNRTTLKPKVEA